MNIGEFIKGQSDARKGLEKQGASYSYNIGYDCEKTLIEINEKNNERFNKKDGSYSVNAESA